MMHMLFTEGWFSFFIAFTMLLVIWFIMTLHVRNLYTYDVVLRRFNVIDLELPSTVMEIPNIIKGIYTLPGNKQKKTISSLKTLLYLDFLFMPAVYGAIFILCMKVSSKMTLGSIIFETLAWLQVIAFVLNIIGNGYLLKKIHPDIVKDNESTHKTFQLIELIKWGIPLVGTICSTSAVSYYWLVGHFSMESLKYLLIITAEIIIFFIALTIFKRKETIDESI